MRFITSIIDGKMKINNRKKADLVKEMKDVLGFKTMDDIKAANKFGRTAFQYFSVWNLSGGWPSFNA